MEACCLVTDPCRVCKYMKTLLLAALVFALFGVFGKTHSFAKKHGLTFGQAFVLGSFWPPDGTFFLWASILTITAFFAALVLGVIWLALRDSLAAIAKRCCPGLFRLKKQGVDDRLSSLEKALLKDPEKGPK